MRRWVEVQYEVENKDILIYILSCFSLYDWSSGVRTDRTVAHAEGFSGFPLVLQQITKILNYSPASKTATKPGKHRCV